MQRFVFQCVFAFWLATMTSSAFADEFSAQLAPFLQQFCSDCHDGSDAEANVDLTGLLQRPRFAVTFDRWHRIAEVIETAEMPPVDMEQPNDLLRKQIASRIRAQLAATAARDSGDPGRVKLRRLTNAEYAYTIEELTGLQFDFDRIFPGDSAGGEGFANVGDVQFLQGSTLDRYLEAAQLVAAHAVVGAGPLQFFHDPGQTGLELSAIDRIQSIYRRYGFRTAAGEGGEPYGMEHYPNGLLVTWLYANRKTLGLQEESLGSLAAKHGVTERFAQHLWDTMHRTDAREPLSLLADRWAELPVPGDGEASTIAAGSRACESLAQEIREWQLRLAATAGDDEEAALMANDLIALAPDFEFQADARWRTPTQSSKIEVSIEPGLRGDIREAAVLWSNFTIRFDYPEDGWSEKRPFREVLPTQQQAVFGAGSSEANAETKVERDELLTVGAQRYVFDIQIPRGADRADIDVEARLLVGSGDHVVRCSITDLTGDKETEADTGRVSAVLADSRGEAAKQWQLSANEFARALPQISHREPAPSDRDPIPAPWDTSYNNAERNDFHYRIKYHREDQFLVESVLDDAGRVELEAAWHDLLTSFDYHDLYFAFTRDKLQLELENGSVAELADAEIDLLPDNARSIVQRLVHGYREAISARRNAASQHVEDAIRLAELAWRRPLRSAERSRLRSFYDRVSASTRVPDGDGDRVVGDQGVLAQHDRAIRALIARILVGPEFLFRVETLPDATPRELSDWEIANRMSYFLWSSPPDTELRRAAGAGELTDSTQRSIQVRRMLRDSRSARFAEQFFGQWFGFYRFDEYPGIDTGQFAAFTPGLKRDMYAESLAFFSNLVRENRPIDEILFADYTFVTEELAKHYQLAGVVAFDKDDARHSVRVDGVERFGRGGLFGLGAIHAVTSAPLRTSPVKRGDWILRRVLGTPVPPPPPDAGSIAADEVTGDGKTIRERLEAHRHDAVCAGCHARIDPLGFALENFDPIGRWRETYRDGTAIDTSGTVRDGSRIDGPAGLRNYMRQQNAQFHRTLARRLIGYALGRSELLTDRALAESMVQRMSEDGGLVELADAIVQSKQFLTRR